MRKTLVLLLPLLMATVAVANPVGKAEAAKKASSLLHKQVVDATPASFYECYLFVGVDGSGFALIAADDCVSPILGYSMNGTFLADSLPHHIRTWIDAYQFDIAASAKEGGVTTKYNTPRDTAVGPLMTTTWNQAPWYNAQCPYSASESNYTVTGCVATAMAQIMKYWNSPAVGRGSHSYNLSGFGLLSANFDTTHYAWDSMPDALDYNSTEAEIAAVAQLMYHAGVAVEMGYGVDGSYATVSSYGSVDRICAENALKNFFRYNQALFTAIRDDYTYPEWDSILSSELNAARPILFSGRDNEGGHAFVIDGYDSLGLYHVNWGWGGYCDGYYTFDNLSPTRSGIGGNPSNSYSYDNRVLLHVFPASEDSLVTVSVVSSDPLIGTVTGSGTFPSYTTTTLHATASEGYRFLSWKSCNHNNPVTFSPNNDYTDTAIFVPIKGDTLGYCFAGNLGLWGEYGSTPSEWAIRIPANAIPARRQFEEVRFYGVSGAEYSVKAYLGANFDRIVSATTLTTQDFAWYSIRLSDPIPLIDSLPIWIVLSSNSYLNPAPYSAYSGNPDGTWYKRAGTTWEHLEDRNEYASWMISAVLREMAPVTISVEVNNPDRGSVTGDGSYYPGDTAILTAIPADGFRFAGWSNGERSNPLHLRVTTSTTLSATFLPSVGIDEVSLSDFQASISGLTLTVSNPTETPVTIYDIQGRQLFTSHLSPFTFQLPAPGVYILRCGGSARRIVAR